MSFADFIADHDDDDGHDHGRCDDWCDDEPPACIADCIMALMPTEDALAGMTEAEAMAAYETAFQGFCACDSTACSAPELEEIKLTIGPLCCNPDFYSGNEIVDCTGVPTMSFADFIADNDDDDGHDHGRCDDWCDDEGHDFCGDPLIPDDPARCMCEECSGCAECSPGGDEPPACIADCIMALMPTEDALAGMTGAEAMAAYETA